MNEDAQLIDAALAGDTEAFGQLVRKYQDRLYNAMVYVVGSVEDARDIVQEAFVQAFVKLETFHGNSAFYTWLYRIAFNASVSRHRRRKYTQSVEQVRDASGDEPSDPNEGPGHRLEQEERAEQVQRALARLSEEHRTVLVLREMEDLSYETIAEMMDVPVGTIRSRLHRARMHLHELLKEVLQEDLQ